MLANTIPAYLYQQYADDDNLQGFVAAYNAATQAYIDWFNRSSLAYYPGLSGALLDWCAEGIYGIARTSFQNTISPSSGPIDTDVLNDFYLNEFQFATTTVYTLTDDAFQRVLTWNFYKGDGNVFTIRWLKRRIMRFLVGTNGLDPKPNQPGFVVGTENTSAIGVVVSSGTLTVTITKSVLSGLFSVTPGILDVFQEAFLGGALELPLQYTYAVNIV